MWRSDELLGLWGCFSRLLFTKCVRRVECSFFPVLPIPVSDAFDRVFLWACASGGEGGREGAVYANYDVFGPK